MEYENVWEGIVAKGKIAPRKKQGTVLVVSLLEDEMRTVCTASDAAGYVTDVKFSPDGNSLAASATDGRVYVYDCLKQFVLAGKSESVGMPTLSLNWSSDSKLIMTNSALGEKTLVAFYDAQSMERVEGAASEEVSKADWETWTATLGMPVKGVYPRDGTRVECMNSVCRSKDETLIVVGDDSGEMKLARYPSVNVGAATKSYRAHSCKRGVSRAVFTKNDDHVVSIGATDRSVCVWKRVRGLDGDSRGEKEYGLSDDSDYAVQAGVGAESTGGDEDSSASANANANEEKKDDTPGDANIINWSSVVANSADSATSLDSSKSFELTTVYGFNPKAGVAYNVAGEALYACGGAAVIYKTATKTQSIFNGNGSPITNLAASPDGRFALTSNAGGSAMVFDALCGIEICKLSNGSAAVATCCFNLTGTMCATISDDKDHTLSVYGTPSGDWRDGALHASSANVPAAVAFVAFAGDDSLVTGGFNHCSFWTLVGNNLTSKDGSFGEVGGMQPQTCGVCTKPGQTVVTGSVGGSLFEWDVATATVVGKVTAHTRCITSISGGDGGFITTGKDGFVKVWLAEGMMNISSFELGGVVNRACSDKSGAKILAALSNGQLKEIVVDSELACVIVSSHRNVYGNIAEEGVKVPGKLGVGCCVAASSGGTVISGGGDGMVRKWNTSFGAMPVTEYNCGAGVSCVAVDYESGVVAVGLGSGVSLESEVVGLEGEFFFLQFSRNFKTNRTLFARRTAGTILFLNAETLEDVAKVQKPDAGCPRCMVAWKGLVYCGCSDGMVHVFDQSGFKFTVNMALSGSVIGVDVSVDAGLIGIAGSNGELKFFTPKGDEKTGEQVGSVDWVGGSLPYSGFTKSIGGVCAAGRSKDGASVLFGLKNGGVGTVGVNSEGDVGATHSGAVSGVSAAPGADMFYTTSREDAGVFCWSKI